MPQKQYTYIREVDDEHVEVSVREVGDPSLRTISKEDWEKIDNSPPPEYPAPTELLAYYYERIKRAADYHYQTYYERLDDPDSEPYGNYAIYAVLNYDGLKCWDWMNYLFQRKQEPVGLRQNTSLYAERLWAQGSRHYFVTKENGAPGYYNYNAGMAKRADEEAQRGAWVAANKAAFSQPYNVLSSDWMGFMSRVQRERGLSISSHINAWDIEPVSELRDRFIGESIGAHMLDIHFHNWLSVDENDWSTVLACPEYQPFIMALCARALIQAVDTGIAEQLGGAELRNRCREDVVRLAYKTWAIAYREQGIRKGLFENANEERPEYEPPSPDLNMLAFPWYCWCYKQTKDRFYGDCAITLLEGFRSANLKPIKHFNQNMLWVPEGLEYMGWEL